MNIDILRMARGQDKHLVHFQCQCISATSRRRGRISARHQEKAIKTKDEDLPDDFPYRLCQRIIDRHAVFRASDSDIVISVETFRAHYIELSAFRKQAQFQ